MKKDIPTIQNEIERLKTLRAAITEKQAKLRAQLARQKDEDDRALAFAVGLLAVRQRNEPVIKTALKFLLPGLAEKQQMPLRRLLGETPGAAPGAGKSA